MKDRIGCWEFLHCEKKNCPAHSASELDCWLLPDTLCSEDDQTELLHKMETCLACQYFYDHIDKENLKPTFTVLRGQLQDSRTLLYEREATLQVQSQELAKGVTETVAALDRLSSGDPDVRIGEHSSIELIEHLKRQVNLTAEEIAEMVEMSHEFAIGLAEHFDVLHRVSRGDLSVRINGTSTVELLEVLKTVTNSMIESVDSALKERAAAEEESRKLEEQLIQAQKMEAIGQLAGGVAHDFNNVLTTIIGLCHLIQRQLDPETSIACEIAEIRQAADRAGALVNQLLAFSRKQLLQPVPLDLNVVASDMKKMLQRLIGEHIDLVTVLAPDIWTVEADEVQLQQVLANLAINARDAMPNGGMLMISTENIVFVKEEEPRGLPLEDGHYVVLSVSDTGVGMDEATRVRVFEPFFTTKKFGKGTGLGLSTVYGIVKQSGGTILLESELELGTNFNIYLPKAISNHQTEALEAELRGTMSGSETVLVVEDDEVVRQLAVRMLQTHGYVAIEAENGEEALALLRARETEPIDLLFTDIVMPVMGGVDLARRARRIAPGLGLLFTTGYTAQGEDFDGEGLNNAHLIHKPYSPAELNSAVRDALEHGVKGRRPQESSDRNS